MRSPHVRGLSMCLVAVWLLDVLVTAWTEHAWLDNLGLESAWRVPFLARLQLFVFASVAVLLSAAWPLRALLPRSSALETLPLQSASRSRLEMWAALFRRYARRAAWLVTTLVALRAGFALASHWPQWLLFRHGEAWGASDPYFGLDLGFWIFRLPFWTQLHAVVWQAVGSLWLMCGILAIGGEVGRLTQRMPATSRAKRAGAVEFDAGKAVQTRVCTRVLGALWFALLALAYGLAIFQDAIAAQPALMMPAASGSSHSIEFPGRTLVPAGYGFTSWWVQRPANIAGAFLSCAVALLWLVFALSSRKERGVRTAPRRSGAWIDAGWTRRLGWPSAATYFLPGALSWLLSIGVQRWLVEPDEVWRERPWLQAHIAMQQAAWQLDAIEEISLRPMPATAVTIKKTLRDVPQMPLWSEAAFSDREQGDDSNAAVTNTANVAPVTCVTIDRYEVASAKPAQQATPEIWATRVREDRDETHATQPRDRVEVFRLSQPRAPTQSTLDGATSATLQVPGVVPLTQPSAALAVGLLDRAARWRPSGGSGGVPVRTLAQRAAWAWRLRAPSLLWTRPIREDERHLWVQRGLNGRAAAIAPFLTASDVSAIVINSRLVWVIDLLAVSAHFPAAMGLEEFASSDAWRGVAGQSTLDGNFARDAGKMVIDARSGATQIYMPGKRAEADPLLRAWQRAFPELLRPFVQMPRAVQAHRRYPRTLLARQLLWLERYHETSAKLSGPAWLERDQWWPASRADTAMRDGAAATAHDITPLDITGLETRIPLGRESSVGRSWVWQTGLRARTSPSLTAVLQAGNDGDDYGRLQLLRFTTPLPTQLVEPSLLEASGIGRVTDEATSLDMQRMKWRLQRGKVLLSLIPTASIQRTTQEALTVHVLMVQPQYRVAVDPNDEDATNVWPLRRVLAADAMQPQRATGQGHTIEQAWHDWNRLAGAGQTKRPELSETALRRVLLWHEAAETAAKAGDWARAAALRQRQKDLLQRLLKVRSNSQSGLP